MAKSKKKKVVMIVDDEDDIRETVSNILEKEGYEVKVAKNADEALEKYKEKPKPDLVLMDIMMPGTPVKKVVPKLKTKVAYLSVVRTSEAEKEELLKSKNVKDFIQKPFDIKELVKRVKKLVG